VTSFAVREDATGAILRTGECQPSDLYLQARSGETAIEVEGNVGDLTHKFEGDNIVELPYVEPEIDVLKQVRGMRGRLLQKSDWTQLGDVNLDTDVRSAWSNYRQSLRDLPETYANATSIEEVIFPEPPE